MSTKFVATKTLLNALLTAKRTLSRIAGDKKFSCVPPTVRSSCEEVSPFTLREGLFYEAP